MPLSTMTIRRMIAGSRSGELIPPVAERYEVTRPAVAMGRVIAFCRARGIKRCIRCRSVDGRTVFSGVMCDRCHVAKDPVYTGMRF